MDLDFTTELSKYQFSDVISEAEVNTRKRPVEEVEVEAITLPVTILKEENGVCDSEPSEGSETSDTSGSEEEFEVCGVCEESENPPYKCPTCYMTYCSVKCCQTHKETGPCTMLGPDNERVTKPMAKHGEIKVGSYFYSTEYTVPPEKLLRLTKGRTFTRLKRLLRYPHVRRAIKYLDESEFPKNKIPGQLQDKEFAAFATFIMKEFEKSPQQLSSSSEDED